MIATRMRTASASLTVLLALAAGLTACGGDSANDKACAARSKLADSLKVVVDDVKAGNLGHARDSMGDVRSQAAALKSAVVDLGAQERDRLQPQIDEVDAQAAGLKDATSLSELSTSISALASSTSDVFAALADDLGCD